MSDAAFSLDALETDALTELVNLGVSRAAASLREMVGEQVLLSVPAAVIVSRARAVELLVGENRTDPLVAVRQGFQGAFSGAALLIFPERNSLELVRAVAGTHLTLEDILELEQEALAEIGNVILNGCMATIANLLERTLTMSLPEIVRGASTDFFGDGDARPDVGVLFIHINFNIKGRDISGYVAMVLDLPSLGSLKDLIVEFIRRTT